MITWQGRRVQRKSKKAHSTRGYFPRPWVASETEKRIKKTFHLFKSKLTKAGGSSRTERHLCSNCKESRDSGKEKYIISLKGIIIPPIFWPGVK